MKFRALRPAGRAPIPGQPPDAGAAHFTARRDWRIDEPAAVVAIGWRNAAPLVPSIGPRRAGSAMC
jgi:hypothetical protein